MFTTHYAHTSLDIPQLVEEIVQEAAVHFSFPRFRGGHVAAQNFHELRH